jgi:hypothetical protein
MKAEAPNHQRKRRRKRTCACGTGAGDGSVGDGNGERSVEEEVARDGEPDDPSAHNYNIVVGYFGRPGRRCGGLGLGPMPEREEGAPTPAPWAADREALGDAYRRRS